MNEKSLSRRGAGDSSGDGDDNGDDNSDCLSNREAYIGDGCCAGTCAENGYGGCYGCSTTSDQDPVNYGGPSCFRAGACIAEEPQGSCPAPADKQDRGTGAEYAGWCVCPGGSFCQGGGCPSNVTAATGVALRPRDRWDPDTVSCFSRSAKTRLIKYCTPPKKTKKKQKKSTPT